MENKTFELMEKMYSDLKSSQEKMYLEMQNGFKKVNERIDNIETKVDKNTMLLEKTQSDMKTLVEIQQSFSEQLDRAKDKDGKSIGDRLEVIELAVTSTSKSLNNNFGKLSNKIDDLQIDVNTLTAKTAKTDTKVIQFERLLNDDKKQG